MLDYGSAAHGHADAYPCSNGDAHTYEYPYPNGHTDRNPDVYGHGGASFADPLASDKDLYALADIHPSDGYARALSLIDAHSRHGDARERPLGDARVVHRGAQFPHAGFNGDPPAHGGAVYGASQQEGGIRDGLCGGRGIDRGDDHRTAGQEALMA